MTEENDKAVNVEENPNLPEIIEKIQNEKIRGRLIIFDIGNSEFAKKLDIKKPGDYMEKQK
ncbi:MAG: hypothetical protein QW727_02235 [Candidatus Pacearchaeota archaeon]